jgi:chromosome segregation ATPase
MIESIMFMGIGFLVAGLLVIGIIPLVHARAVRLTMRRLEALTPLSMAEIQADRDQLRAEFAMSTRRLEMSVEQMRAKTTSQLAEIGKKSEEVGRLKLELGERTAALFALEAKENQLNDDLQGLRNELAAKVSAFEETERMLAPTQSELTQVTGNFRESDSQRVELMALRAQIEVLKSQIESFEQEVKGLRDRLTYKTSEAAMYSQQLTEERMKGEQAGNRISELDRQILAQATEAEVLNRRVQELTARLDEQGRFLADREFVSDQLRNEALAAQKTEAEVRAALAEAESRQKLNNEALGAEKTQVEDQLKQAQAERAKLQAEIAAMTREAENAWGTERVENAVLRERINDVAAEVAWLTSALEGPQSPIDAILSAEAGRPAMVNGGSSPIAPTGSESKGSLADRIRALQSRASSVAKARTKGRATKPSRSRRK